MYSLEGDVVHTYFKTIKKCEQKPNCESFITTSTHIYDVSKKKLNTIKLTILSMFMILHIKSLPLFDNKLHKQFNKK